MGLRDFINNAFNLLVMGEIEANLGQARQNLEEADEVSRSNLDGKLNELMARIEELEVQVAQDERSDDTVIEKIERLEQEVEGLERLENFDSRMNEMSEELVRLQQDMNSRIKEQMDEELEDRVQPLFEFKDQMQETLQMQKELKESLESEQDMDDLWQALDNEFADIERRMHENEVELEDLRSDVAELSGLIKALTSKK